MSKSAGSENSYIALMDSPDVIRRKIRRAVTDSGTEVRGGPDKPALTNLLDIYSILCGETGRRDRARATRARATRTSRPIWPRSSSRPSLPSRRASGSSRRTRATRSRSSRPAPSAPRPSPAHARQGARARRAGAAAVAVQGGRPPPSFDHDRRPLIARPATATGASAGSCGSCCSSTWRGGRQALLRYVSHSAAMEADGFHSLFDGASNVIGLVGSGSRRARPTPAPVRPRQVRELRGRLIGIMLAFAGYTVGRGAIDSLSRQRRAHRGHDDLLRGHAGTLGVNLFVTTVGASGGQSSRQRGPSWPTPATRSAT